MEVTSLSKKPSKNLPSLDDAFCLPCVDSMESGDATPQQCKSPAKRMHSLTPSSPEETCQAESTWNTIIINQIPLNIDQDKFISVFSQYGAIADTYLCKEVKKNEHKHERIAQITFNNEEDAWKVLEASQRKLIKYDDHILMITVASDDYSPIQNLPNECLREIFLRLSLVTDKFTVEKVCKLWNSIGRESWSSVTKISEYWSSTAWRIIAPRVAHSLHDIKLSLSVEQSGDPKGVSEDSRRTLSLIAEHCVSLEKLMTSLDTSKLSKPRKTVFRNLYVPYLRSIISKNKCLRRLSLWGIHLHEDFIDSFPADVEEIRLDAITFECLSLRPVDVSRFQNLRVLKLSSFFIDEDQLKGIETLKNLQVLNFIKSKVHSSNIKKMIHLTKLEYLAIPGCKISDVTLSKILRNNEGLKQLDISGIHGITNLSFQWIRKLKYLEVLMMESLNKMPNLTGMASLHTLDCNWCYSIRDETIERLLSPASMISRLYIYNCPVTLKCFTTANKWVLNTGKSLDIFVNKEMAKHWEDSGLKKPSSTSSNITEGLHVSIYQPCQQSYSLENDWNDSDSMNCDN